MTRGEIMDNLYNYLTPSCTIDFAKKLETLDDVLSTEWNDITVHNWVKGEKLVDEVIEMAV
jgi:hypothetical protein